MKPRLFHALTFVLPLALVGAAITVSVVGNDRSKEEAAYQELIRSSAHDEILLDQAQLRAIAPFAVRGRLITLKGAGTDMRKDAEGKPVDNYGLACLELTDGATTNRLLRLISGEAIPVADPDLNRKIHIERPCDRL